MILIASAAYVNSEFQIEFGKLPPAFLPIGNRRLFERQIELLRRHFPGQGLHLSIPRSFAISPMDQAFLTRMGVVLLQNEDDLVLADSIALALESSNQIDSSLHLLHGDTLFTHLPLELDVIGVSRTNSDYNWEIEAIDLDSEMIWAGYFSFSNLKQFLADLKNSGGNFTDGVRLYEQRTPLARLDMGEWFDFGHINTYFNNRAKITTERSFNSLVIKDGCVKKTGDFSSKIEAEGKWFLNLPASLKPFCPQLIECESGSSSNPAAYVLEYLPLPPLNEIFVHGKNPVFYWKNIFQLIAQFFSLCIANGIEKYEIEKINSDFSELVNAKSWERLRGFVFGSSYPSIDVPNSINGITLPTLRSIVKECLGKIRESDARIGVLHGDFCLSNILFESRLGRIKVIDPRGLNAKNQFSLYGDLRYDLAKLTHSVIGLYDHILAGAYSLEREYRADLCSFELRIYVDERVEGIQQTFIDREFLPGLKPLDVMPLTILLFISMLELHADEPRRQDALLANALRLYDLYMHTK